MMTASHPLLFHILDLVEKLLVLFINLGSKNKYAFIPNTARIRGEMNNMAHGIRIILVYCQVLSPLLSKAGWLI